MNFDYGAVVDYMLWRVELASVIPGPCHTASRLGCFIKISDRDL